MAGKTGRRGGFALPIVMSLGLHGLLVAILCWTPTPQEKQARVSVETCAFLSMDDQAVIHSAVVSLAAPTCGSESETAITISGIPKKLPEIVTAKKMAPTPSSNQSGSGAELTAGQDIRATGSGGNAGGGVGVGRVPLFGSIAPGQRVVYLLDRSLSMGPNHALDHARRELLASLKSLPATASFQVIAYNRQAEPIYLDNTAKLLVPDEATLARVAYVLNNLPANGSTDHGRAIRRALALRPDVIYLVTDADDLSREEVQAVTRLNDNRTTIHTIKMGGRNVPLANSPLRFLAQANRGTYRSVALAN